MMHASRGSELPLQAANEYFQLQLRVDSLSTRLSMVPAAGNLLWLTLIKLLHIAIQTEC